MDTPAASSESNDVDKASTLSDESPTERFDVSDRAARCMSALGLTDKQAWLLAVLYSPTYYANAIAADVNNERENFEHFLAVGLAANISPSPLVDSAYLQQQFDSDSEQDKEQAAIVRWITTGTANHMVPNDWFDEHYYVTRYPDLKENVEWGFHHYACGGFAANRLPSPLVEHFVNSLLTDQPKAEPNFFQLTARVPYGCLSTFLSGESQAALRKLFMPELYRAQVPTLNTLSDDALFAHYIFIGQTDNARPSVLFHESTYKQSLIRSLHEHQKIINSDQLHERLTEDSRLEAIPSEAWPLAGSDPWIHWFLIGRLLDVIPTPLFETDFYLTAHPELSNNLDNSAFEHYVFTGVHEPWRQPGPYFSASEYQFAGPEPEHDNVLLDYVINGQFNAVKPVFGFNTDLLTSDNPLQESAAEKAALQIGEKLDRLNQGVLQAMVNKVLVQEPQFAMPYGPRNIRFAPQLHPEIDIMQVAENIRQDLPKAHYESVILIPHCRMAGSARIAGIFAGVLGNLTHNQNILVLTTDVDVFERPDWFPEGMDIFNISQYFTAITMEQRVRVLLDLVRGVQPSRLFNINSNLGWQLTSNYCRQLSEWMDLYFYLFCWEKDTRGNKYGYPIEWFLPTFDYCKGVFTDSLVLAKELQDRYCPTPALKKKIVCLHTPANDRNVSYHEVLQHRATLPATPRRVFWSGRFDRQKRIDLLLEIARLMPDVEFWVWGKSVISDTPTDLSSSTPNLRLMGSYTHIDEVPIGSCDCFLYTAGWDGLPTVLIEVGSRAVPVVASAVGGVVDLITDETGWPVEDSENPEAYMKAINAVTDDYPTALVKAQKLREHTLQLCDEERYKNQVNSMISGAAS